MTSYEPPDDPSEAPTGQYGYGERPGEPDPGSRPWHRRPAALVALGVLVAALLALVIFGLVELTREGGGSTPTSTSTTSAPITTSTAPATSPSSTTSSTTRTEPVAPAPTTSVSTAPTSTTIEDGHHHRHHHDGGMP